MNKHYFYIIALLLSIGLSTVQAEERKIVVRGEATIASDPEVATFSINLSVVNEEISILEKKYSALLQHVLTLLKDAGINEKDILTSVRNDILLEGVGSVPTNTSYSNRYEGSVAELGEGQKFQISSGIHVFIDDLSKINQLSKLFSGMKTINFGNIIYRLKDDTKLKEQALSEAIKDAKQNAKIVARLTGLQLGKLLKIGTTGNSYYSGTRTNKQYAFGKIMTSRSIEVTFEALPSK
jgi:uncharacterized protein YggE